MKSRRNSKHPHFRQHFNKTSSIQLDVFQLYAAFLTILFFAGHSGTAHNIHKVPFWYGQSGNDGGLQCVPASHPEMCTVHGTAFRRKDISSENAPGFSIQNIFPENALFCQLFQIAVNRRCSNGCAVFFQLLSQVGNGEVFACISFQQIKNAFFLLCVITHCANRTTFSLRW